MALISLEFGLFYMVFFAAWWSLKKDPRWQNALLTLTSLGLLWFYATPVAVGCLLLFSLAMWLFSRGIVSSPDRRQLWLGCGIALAVAHLAFWKHADFFRLHLQQGLAAPGAAGLLNDAYWVLPLGVSYYTFQGIAYLVACYRGGEAERLEWWNLLGFLGLFLTLTSGPIARTREARGLSSGDGQACGALEQIRAREPRRILAPNLALTLILLGIFKKWLLAGWLGTSIVGPVFNNPYQYQSLDVLAAIYGYTLQLFFDFSGYSELVVGLAMLLGLRLPVNFRTPLLARNLREFWDRWHISLSTWIRDYLYIPLGGSRKGFLRTQANLLIAFGLSGAWHGPTLNFVLWGLLHGAGMVWLNGLDRLAARLGKAPVLVPGRTRRVLARLGGIAANFVTVQFVCFAFVLFRASSFDDARLVLEALCGNRSGAPQNADTLPLLLGLPLLWALWPLLRQLPGRFAQALELTPMVLRPVLLLLVFVLIVQFAPPGIPDFIYAKF